MLRREKQRCEGQKAPRALRCGTSFFAAGLFACPRPCGVGDRLAAELAAQRAAGANPAWPRRRRGRLNSWLHSRWYGSFSAVSASLFWTAGWRSSGPLHS